MYCIVTYIHYTTYKKKMRDAQTHQNIDLGAARNADLGAAQNLGAARTLHLRAKAISAYI